MSTPRGDRDGATITAEQIVARSEWPTRRRYRSVPVDLLNRTLRALDALRRIGQVEKIGTGAGYAGDSPRTGNFRDRRLPAIRFAARYPGCGSPSSV